MVDTTFVAIRETISGAGTKNIAQARAPYWNSSEAFSRYTYPDAKLSSAAVSHGGFTAPLTISGGVPLLQDNVSTAIAANMHSATRGSLWCLETTDPYTSGNLNSPISYLDLTVYEIAISGDTISLTPASTQGFAVGFDAGMVNSLLTNPTQNADLNSPGRVLSSGVSAIASSGNSLGTAIDMLNATYADSSTSSAVAQGFVRLSATTVLAFVGPWAHILTLSGNNFTGIDKKFITISGSVLVITTSDAPTNIWWDGFTNAMLVTSSGIFSYYPDKYLFKEALRISDTECLVVGFENAASGSSVFINPVRVFKVAVSGGTTVSSTLQFTAVDSLFTQLAKRPDGSFVLICQTAAEVWEHHFFDSSGTYVSSETIPFLTNSYNGEPNLGNYLFVPNKNSGKGPACLVGFDPNTNRAVTLMSKSPQYDTVYGSWSFSVKHAACYTHDPSSTTSTSSISSFGTVPGYWAQAPALFMVIPGREDACVAVLTTVGYRPTHVFGDSPIRATAAVALIGMNRRELSPVTVVDRIRRRYKNWLTSWTNIESVTSASSDLGDLSTFGEKDFITKKLDTWDGVSGSYPIGYPADLKALTDIMVSPGDLVTLRISARAGTVETTFCMAFYDNTGTQVGSLWRTVAPAIGNFGNLSLVGVAPTGADRVRVTKIGDAFFDHMHVRISGTTYPRIPHFFKNGSIGLNQPDDFPELKERLPDGTVTASTPGRHYICATRTETDVIWTCYVDSAGMYFERNGTLHSTITMPTSAPASAAGGTTTALGAPLNMSAFDNSQYVHFVTGTNRHISINNSGTVSSTAYPSSTTSSLAYSGLLGLQTRGSVSAGSTTFFQAITITESLTYVLYLIGSSSTSSLKRITTSVTPNGSMSLVTVVGALDFGGSSIGFSKISPLGVTSSVHSMTTADVAERTAKGIKYLEGFMLYSTDETQLRQFHARDSIRQGQGPNSQSKTIRQGPHNAYQ